MPFANLDADCVPPPSAKSATPFAKKSPTIFLFSRLAGYGRRILPRWLISRRGRCSPAPPPARLREPVLGPVSRSCRPHSFQENHECQPNTRITETISFTVESGGADDICYASESRLAFRADSTSHEFAIGINAFLSGDVKRVAGDYSIAEGKIGRSGEFHHSSFLGESGPRSRLDKQHNDGEDKNNPQQRPSKRFRFSLCVSSFSRCQNSLFTFTRRECWSPRSYIQPGGGDEQIAIDASFGFTEAFCPPPGRRCYKGLRSRNFRWIMPASIKSIQLSMWTAEKKRSKTTRGMALMLAASLDCLMVAASDDMSSESKAVVIDVHPAELLASLPGANRPSYNSDFTGLPPTGLRPLTTTKHM